MNAVVTPYLSVNLFLHLLHAADHFPSAIRKLTYANFTTRGIILLLLAVDSLLSLDVSIRSYTYYEWFYLSKFTTTRVYKQPNGNTSARNTTRVTRPCNTGAIRVTLSTRVMPGYNTAGLYGRHTAVCTGNCVRENFCLKSSKELDMLCFFVNMVAIRAAYGCVFWRRTTRAVLISKYRA